MKEKDTEHKEKIREIEEEALPSVNDRTNNLRNVESVGRSKNLLTEAKQELEEMEQLQETVQMAAEKVSGAELIHEPLGENGQGGCMYR